MIYHPLQKILSPQSIAIAGASNTPAKMGTIVYLNLIHGGFSGDIFALHPVHKNIFGKPAYSSVETLPFKPDLAILIVPCQHVVKLLEDFGKTGTRHAIVVSGGFKETGKSGQTLEAEMMKVAKDFGIRILGPNCLGVINTACLLNTTVIPLQDKPGSFSIASQSGTYVTQTLACLKQKGVRLSKTISVGNEADIDLCDCLEYLAEDQETRCIGLYIESIKRVDRFLAIAREVTKKKPVIAQYVGGTSAGARSGASHTGAMAGPDFLYDGLFHQAGIIRADTIENVFELGNALALSFPPHGKRIGILTNSGGPGTGMASTLDNCGMEVPEFSKSLRKKIEKFLPEYASSKNPVDLTFHTDMELMADKIPNVLLQSGEIDGLLIHGIMDTGFADLLYPIFKDVLNISFDDFKAFFLTNLSNLIAMPLNHKIPILISSFMVNDDHCLQTFRDCGIPTFNTPEKAAHAMATLFKYGIIQTQQPDYFRTDDVPIPAKASAIMRNASASTMNEHMAKQILRTYEIPTCLEILAFSKQEAISAADDIGYPVVIKGCLPGTIHKSDHNLVYVDCRNQDDVKMACEAISSKSDRSSFLVCEMLSRGREFMAGMTRFRDFPPCILFGIGGIFTEAIKDFSVRLIPFGKTEAIRLMKSVKCHPLLSTFRGKPPVDLNAFADILISLGQIATHFPQIKEIDLNPVLIDGNKPKVVDALFVI